MSSGPTYYELFGVSPAATAAQIRAAYLSLMKQHHPDLVDGGERELASDYAAILNRSYAVLKDPDARARYNAHLADQSFLRWRRAPKRRALITGAVYRRRTREWDGSSFGAGLLVLACAGVAYAATLAPPRTPAVAWAAAAPRLVEAAGPVVPGSLTRQEGLADLRVRDQARRAILATPEQAVVESRDCFRSARTRLDRSDTELCVIFDEAYLDWQDASSVPLGRDDYFNQLVVGIRHRDAMAALGPIDPSRLDALRDIALNALLGEVREAERRLPAEGSYDASATLFTPGDLSQ